MDKLCKFTNKLSMEHYFDILYEKSDSGEVKNE